MSPRIKLVWRIKWRPESDGDWFEQDWESTTRSGAIRRWSNFWGMLSENCAVFTAELTN